MVKKEELFFLIKSLSKSEKRYFKLFCQREASGQNYQRLFDAIDKQSVYNEKHIKEEFHKEKFTKQLHVTKNYLAKLILKSLRNFHSSVSREAELKDLLRNVEILYNKELYVHSKRELNRAEKLAKSNELTVGLVEINVWKRKLEQVMRPNNYAVFRATIEKQNNAIAELENNNKYWRLAVDISSSMFGVGKDPLNDIHLLSDPGNARTLESKVLHYNTSYLWYLQNGNRVEAEQKLYELIALLEQHPERIQGEPGLYVSTINNLLSFLLFSKKYREALDLAQKAKAVYDRWNITSENRGLLRQILRTYNIELEIYRELKSYDERRNFIESVERFVSDHVYKMPKEYLLSFWFQLASIHFMRKDFKRSLYWINQLLNARFKNLRTDLVVQTMILNLIVHFEQQNLFVLRYFVDSTKRYMKKVKNFLPYETILLRFFIKIGRLPLLEYRSAFGDLKRQLFPANGGSLIPEDARGFIDYGSWINEKVKKGVSAPVL